MREPNSVIRYMYNFACGGSSHELRLYESYSKDLGLGPLEFGAKDSNINNLIPQFELNEKEINEILVHAAKRSDSAIIDRYGDFLSDF